MTNIIDNDEKIVSIVLEECNKLEKILNDNLLKTFADMHNISSEFNQLKLKQEVIAKSAFFMDVKKKYGLHIINKEGKKVDELEIKGMVIRRSEYPEFTKIKIKEVLNMLLKNEHLDFKKINEFSEDVKQEAIRLIKEGDKQIAGTVSFAKDLSEYKTLTGHIKGMILWNDMEYDYFVPGTKGSSFRIKGVDHFNSPEKILKKVKLLTRKNTTIVLPFEEGNLPEYYIIDVQKQLEYVWTKRINEILRCFKRPSHITVFDFNDADALLI